MKKHKLIPVIENDDTAPAFSMPELVQAIDEAEPQNPILREQLQEMGLSEEKGHITNGAVVAASVYNAAINGDMKAVDKWEAYKQEAKSKAMRDSRGVRILKYKRYKEGIDYAPVNTDIMATIMEMEKINMARMIKRRGRPPKFNSVEELQQEIYNYFEYIAEANRNECALIPDTEGLASFLGVGRDTLNEWERSNSIFSATIKVAKNSIAAVKKQLGMQGRIPNGVLALDFNNNHGYVYQQNLKLEPVNPLGAERSAEEIMSKYQDAPEVAMLTEAKQAE